MAERLFLRAFEYEDLSFINKLRNDDITYSLTCGNKYFISSERDKKWIEDKIFNNFKQLYLMICKADGCIPIGYICATDIDYVNRKAQFGGVVIDKAFLNSGYGTASARLLLKHLFSELNMNLIYGYCRTDHVVSLKMLEKLGFQNCGLVRSFLYKQNKFHDVYLVCIVKDEFESVLNNVNK